MADPGRAGAGVELSLLVGVLLAAAVVGVRYGFKRWRTQRLIEDTPESRLRSAAQGYVHLTGRGMPLPGQRIAGPLTCRPCIWWRYEIHDRSRGADGPRTVAREASEAPFLLDDGTGRCIVDPRGAEVHATVREVWYGASEWPEVRIPDGTGVFGRFADLLLPRGRYRYIEHRLDERAPLLALGSYRSIGGAGAEATDDAVARLLHDWKEDQAALVARFDTNHDGRIGVAEWEAARAAAREQVLAASATAPVPAPRHVLASTADGRPFVLASSSRELLARGFRLQALASVSVFVAVLAALAWIMTNLW
jgi:hypothetical protein